MKVQRYQSGRANVQKLREQRSRMLTPEEAGQAAAAPFNAVADIAGTASDALLKIQDVKNKAIDAEDKLKADEALAVAADRYKAEKARIDADDSIPASELEAVTQDIIQEYVTAGDSLSERNRAEYMKRSGVLARGLIRDAELDSMVMQTKKLETASLNAFNRLIANDNPLGAESVYLTAKEHGLTDEANLIKMEAALKGAEQERAVETGFKQWLTASDQEAFHANVVNDTSGDPDVRDALIKRIEGEINNQQTVEKQLIKKASIGFEREVTDMMMKAKAGNLSVEEIDDLVSRADAFGSDILSSSASGWRNKLYLATVQGAKTQVDNSVYARQLRAGPGATVNSDSNRKSLQAYAQEIAGENSTEEERVLIENQLTKVAGYPPENVTAQLKGAGAGFNSGALINAATRVLEITDGDVWTGVDLGLTNQEHANIMRVARAVRSGDDPIEVANEVVQYNKKMRDDRVVTTGLQKNLGTLKSTGYITEGFDDMMNNAYDSLFTWEATMTEGEEQAARIRFQDYYDQAYIMSDGDQEAALATAQMRFQGTHALTYINGEAELQFGGIRAGSEELGDELFASDLLGKQFIAVDDTGTSIVTVEDRDDIKFRRPQMIDGVQTYQVYMNDAPMFSDDPQMGRRAVFVQIDEATELALLSAADAEEIKGIQEEIADLESQLKKAERMKDNIYVGSEQRSKLRDLPNEIQRLQNKINRIKG